MSYAPPTISSSGLTVPSYADIFNFLVSKFQTIYGNSVNLDNSSSDAQLISLFALAASDGNAALQQEYSNRAPNFATGAALDSLCSLIGIARKAATFSTVTVTVSGTAGAIITNGVVVDNVFGFQWDLPSPTIIGGGGIVSVVATCETLGAVNLPINSAIGIGTPTLGWTGVTNPAISVPGLAVESDSQLRTRFAQSVELPSQTILAGTVAAIAAVPNVTRYNIDENTGATTNVNGTPGHSIQAVVENGTDLAIATAIFNNRGLGCGTFGSTSVTVTDPNTGLATPIAFDRPTNVPIFITVNAHNQAGGSLTVAQIAAIKAALLAYLATLQIGQTVSFGELVQAAASINANPATPAVSIRSPFYLGRTSGTVSLDLAMAFNEVAQGVIGDITVNSV